MRSAGVRSRVLGCLLALGACAGPSACGGGGSATDPDDGDGAPTFVELFGPSLVTADGSSVGTQALQGKALVGVYFAAGWCPACAAFTPLLVSAYGEWRKADRSFEIVLASLDHSSPEMFSHMKARGMGWLAIPYDAARIRALAERYDVQWIPTLIVMDGDRTIITTGGRDDVAAKGAAAFDAWLAASQGR